MNEKSILWYAKNVLQAYYGGQLTAIRGGDTAAAEACAKRIAAIKKVIARREQSGEE